MNQSQPKTLTILIVDDHELVLGGTLSVLKQQYPDANIVTAQTAQEGLQQVSYRQPDVAIVDLSMPETVGETAHTDTGIQLLKTLMEQFPTLNIVVQSAHPRSLVRLKGEIIAHEGGFTVADKSFPKKEMLIRVDWAIRGYASTPKEMWHGLEVKPEWLEVLRLAFQEGLQDRAIAEKMNVAERTVRHYWTKIQDVLDVYPDTGKNIRVQTGLRAREEGLID